MHYGERRARESHENVRYAVHHDHGVHARSTFLERELRSAAFVEPGHTRAGGWRTRRYALGSYFLCT